MNKEERKVKRAIKGLIRNFIKKHIFKIIFTIIMFIISLLIYIYNHKYKGLIIYILEALSYIATIIGAISILFAYFKYKNDKQDKENTRIYNTMHLINYFIDYIYPIINDLDNILNNKVDYYKKTNNIINNKKNSFNKSDISSLKEFLHKNNDKRKYTEAMIQTYALENINFDKFESWSNYYILLDESGLIKRNEIIREYESTFSYYMEHFSIGLKIIDPNKDLFFTCHKLYKKWNKKDFF